LDADSVPKHDNEAAREIVTVKPAILAARREARRPEKPAARNMNRWARWPKGGPHDAHDQKSKEYQTKKGWNSITHHTRTLFGDRVQSDRLYCSPNEYVQVLKQ